MEKVKAIKHFENITDINEYEKLLKEDIEKHLLKSEDDIRNGRVRDAKEVFKEWKEKYGI